MTSWPNPSKQGATHSLSVELEHDSRPGPLPEHGPEALGLGADPLLDQLASLFTSIAVVRDVAGEKIARARQAGDEACRRLSPS